MYLGWLFSFGWSRGRGGLRKPRGGQGGQDAIEELHGEELDPQERGVEEREGVQGQGSVGGAVLEQLRHALLDTLQCAGWHIILQLEHTGT